MAQFDVETVERLRSLSPGEILDTVRELAYAAGGGSDQHLELLEAVVRQGLLTWEEIEDQEGPPRE